MRWRQVRCIMDQGIISTIAESDRKAGVEWIQTILEVGTDDNGKRFSKKLRASEVPNRYAAILQSHLAATVQPDSRLQTDMWKGYSGM